MNSDDVSPWLIRGVYLFGLALMLHAVIDLSTTVWPLRFTEMTWRYGFLGLAAGYLQTPILGLLLIAGTAVWYGDYGLARIVGVVFLVSALLLLFATGIFMLDVVQVRQLRDADAQDAVLYGGVFQSVKYVLAAFIGAFSGHGLLETVRSSKRGVPKTTTRGPIISGPE